MREITTLEEIKDTRGPRRAAYFIGLLYIARETGLSVLCSYSRIVSKEAGNGLNIPYFIGVKRQVIG